MILRVSYALRECHSALLTGSKAALASCSQGAAGGGRWLLTAVRGHLGDTRPKCVGQVLGGVPPSNDRTQRIGQLPLELPRDSPQLAADGPRTLARLAAWPLAIHRSPPKSADFRSGCGTSLLYCCPPP